MDILPATQDINDFTNKIWHCQAEELLAALPDASVNLIATDPPYFGVKDAAWDNAWENDNHFIEWVKSILLEYRRVLVPNGSLYFFASPRMAARVEVAIGEYFNILNRITWAKPQGWQHRTEKEEMRGYFPSSEAIIFAEQFGSEKYANSESGYELQCQYLCRKVFQIADLCNLYAVTRSDIGRLIVSDYKNIESANAQASNWILGKNIPNKSDFMKLKTIIPIKGEYEELRKEYEELRKEYEALRRPFNASEYRPYTDVWTYRTVQAYNGKHECEKPIELMKHIIETSSRKGDIVLDTFAGSGATLDAARQLGRQFISCDFEKKWVKAARKRVSLDFTRSLWEA